MERNKAPLLRLYNARILPFTGENELIEGEVWVKGDTIAYVGAPCDNKPEFEREIDLRGGLLLPGFKNAHAHSAMTFLRSYAEDLPLQEWLFNRVFPMEARLNPERVYAFTRLAVLEYLAGGITSAFDMYFYRDAFAAACEDMGFRAVICGALSAGDSPETAEDDYRRYNSRSALISYKFGVHAEYTASVELLKSMSELTHSYKAPFWAHNSETKKEVAECLERHGMTPTELFDSLGLFDYGGGGFHCVHFAERDMDIFTRRGLYAVTCPGSNAKLASGIAPLGEFARRGVRLAIGTDGPASNNALDMLREMYLACVLQKLQSGDAAAGSAGDVLKAACSGGAIAMGLDDCDSIQTGKRADITVIDLDKPGMRPIHDPVRNLVYSGTRDCVRLTMIAGRILYEDGNYYTGDSPERIYAEAERCAKELFN